MLTDIQASIAKLEAEAHDLWVVSELESIPYEDPCMTCVRTNALAEHAYLEGQLDILYRVRDAQAN